MKEQRGRTFRDIVRAAEATAAILTLVAGVPFALAMKAPLVAADAVLAFLLARWGAREGGAARGAGWAYALHPVALLVVAVSVASPIEKSPNALTVLTPARKS